MAVERTVKLDLDAKDVLKKLENIEKELNNVKDEVGKNTEEMGNLGRATASTADKMDTLAGGIGFVAVSLKALVISSVLKAFDMFFDILRNNQFVLDATNKAFETMNITIKTLVNDIVNITTTGVLKNFFNDLKNTSFSLDNVTSSLRGLISNINIFQSFGQNVFGAVFGNLKNRVKDAQDLADQIVDLRNEVLLAEADQRILQLTYQKEAEIQRQIRDDIRKTPEERLKANIRLGEILEEQFLEEQKLADKKLELAQLERTTDKENIQFKVNEKIAIADLADLEERITGQRSEQVRNDATLRQEIAEDNKKLVEQETAILLENKPLEISKNNVEDRLALKRKENADLLDLANQNAEDEEEITAKKLETLKQMEMSGAESILSALNQLAGEGTALAKATALTQILINSAQAVSGAIKAGAGVPFPGNLGAIATGVGAVLSGIASAKNIFAKADSSDAGSIDTQTSISQGQVQSLGSLVPNISAIETPDLGNEPIQAFVVENDISNSQALQEQLQIQATL